MSGVTGDIRPVRRVAEAAEHDRRIESARSLLQQAGMMSRQRMYAVAHRRSEQPFGNAGVFDPVARAPKAHRMPITRSREHPARVVQLNAFTAMHAGNALQGIGFDIEDAVDGASTHEFPV